MTGHADIVYDRFVANEKLQSGTKYERLAAIVFRLLTEDTVLHDLRLRGEVGVPHQIDVVVGDDANRRRILIEAKDYTRNVDLPVVRDFSAVVADLEPDEAFVVSTVGFSANAVKWAKAKDLKLAIMRIPEDDDWGDLVKGIQHELNMSAPSDPNVEWHVDRSEASRFANDLNPIGMRAIEDVFTADSDGHLTPFGPILQPQIDAEYRGLKAGTPGTLAGEHKFKGPTWLHLPDEAPIRVNGYSWTVKVVVATHTFRTGIGVGGLSAELVLRTLDGSIHRVFTNRQLANWNFDGNRVVPQDS